MLAAETVLQNRYRIVRLLGQGGMGAVYEAIDERLETTVALKESLFTDERLRKQFEREAKLLAGMHHPALPRVSDHFAEGDGVFLVMQFIPGDDLAQMMARKHGPFPPDQVLTWGDQLLDALDYLHTQDPQIIHRDIKPQNLKLTGRGQIILLDFGLAKGQAGGVSVVTTSASIYGYTPNYAPLEQIQGLGTDARSDIYALSATLYHLMTAVKPPDALTRAAALVNAQPDPLVPANLVSGNIGPEVASVLARGMSQNRDQRYPTAAGMRAALNGTEEVATLSGRSEAPTVLHAQTATTIREQASDDATATMLKHGETTVVRSKTPMSGKRAAPWAIGAAALVLIGGLSCVYYAYQHRNSTATVEPTSSPQPANINAVQIRTPAPEHASSEPASGSLKDANRDVVVSHAPILTEPAKRNEKTAKRKDKGQSIPDDSDDEPDPNVGQQTNNPRPVPPVPNDGEVFVPVRPLPQMRVRTRPDGALVRQLPDGTRIVTKRDGSTQVIPPPRKNFRRKNAH
ncbi:MAG TPA: serine/threonine-protein kinase [Pyrinomonadaceae bacterium]|nr:serine/threonine-protein kinase [Pyrinomonadaceae bacterium]